MSDDLHFNVVQYFKDDTHEYVRRGVGARAAVLAAKHYTHSVAAQLGFVQRVIITDDGDDTCFEWKFGEGVTFPVGQPTTYVRTP